MYAPHSFSDDFLIRKHNIMLYDMALSRNIVYSLLVILSAINHLAVAGGLQIDTIISVDFSLKETNSTDDGFDRLNKFIDWIDFSEFSLSTDNIGFDLSGLPDTWSDVRIGMIVFDPLQYNYQKALSDHAAPESIPATFDNKINHLVSTPIKCFVAIASGTNEQGEIEFIIDANNDGAFGSERIISHSDITHNLRITVTVECIKMGNVVTKELPVNLNSSNNDNTRNITYHIPIVGIANLHYNNTTYEIKILSAYATHIGFTNCKFIVRKVYSDSENSYDMNPFEQFDYLIIADDVFKVLSVDIYYQKLFLEKVESSTDVFLPQIGFSAPVFSASSIINGTAISLDSLKGKYVLIDFWATWCPPCIKEMENIREIYGWLAKQDIVVISINVDSRSDAEQVKTFVESRNFNWNHILSKDIAEMYRVTNIPANFLIDPKGVVVAKAINFSSVDEIISKL